MSMDREISRKEKSRASPHWWMAAGVFLVVLAVYILTNPGRIDLIDGQIRYEVALNWLLMDRPVILDRMIPSRAGIPGRHHFAYSYFGAGASVASMPLVWMGTRYDDPPGEASRFMFSLTTSVFGAFAAALLYLFYVELGLTARQALAWTAVATFATLQWPASDTIFDNGQHACLLLAAVFLGHLSARRNSWWLAASGGLVAGLLFTYQEYFVLILPALAISTIDWSSWSREGRSVGAWALLRPLWVFLRSTPQAAVREFMAPTELSPAEAKAFHRACWRYAAFMIATLAGVALTLDYNYWRFGSAFESGKVTYDYQTANLFGNPLAGLLTLLVSPGKSILLYSPPMILGLLGIRRFWRHKPSLGFVTVATSVILVLFLSTIAFASGDWCWGPRYLVPLLPLWALAFPYASLQGKFRRFLLVGTVGAGLLVQGLALSVENQRFFFERGLPDFFWAYDSWFYFKHSALEARFGETLSLLNGPPASAQAFNTYNLPPTYTTMGVPAGFPYSRAPEWMRQFKVFYYPRPWVFWMRHIPPDDRPINMAGWLGGILGVVLLGLGFLARGHELSARDRARQEAAANENAAFLEPS